LETDDTEFPDCDIKETVSVKEDFCIESEILNKVKKNIPSGKYTLPILESIQILHDENNTHLITTDLNVINDVKVKNSDSRMEWPNWKAIQESINQQTEKGKITLSVDQLEIMVKIMKERKDEVITLTVYESNQAVKVENYDKNLTGYIMPILEG
jgi:hypothetical protein